MKKGTKAGAGKLPKVISITELRAEEPEYDEERFVIPEAFAFASAAPNGLIAGMSDEDKNAPFSDIREALVKESWLLSDLMTVESRKRFTGATAVSDAQLPLPLDAGKEV